MSQSRCNGGFTIIELLIAMTITLLLAGTLLGAVRPAREAFDRVPAEIDAQQRGRTAVDAISQAVRSAGRNVAATATLGPLSNLLPAVSVSEPDESGFFTELTAIVPVTDGAQGVLDIDQTSPGGFITLAIAPCPNVKDVCGFAAGHSAVIADDAGHFEVFTIASTNAGARRLMPSSALAHAYPAGSAVVEVDQFTFSLAEQADASYSLIRTTAAGAIQPIVDYVDGLWFELLDDQVVIWIETGDRVFKTSVNVRNAP